MPYLKPKNRERLLRGEVPKTGGELNFLFTETAKKYLKVKGESYKSYNDIIGALEGAKLELYRRLVSKYEDKKILENGDVYV